MGIDFPQLLGQRLRSHTSWLLLQTSHKYRTPTRPGWCLLRLRKHRSGFAIEMRLDLMSLDVIEHVADHHGFLSACAQEMGPGGYIYNTVPVHQVPAEALI
jgi:hypothetical protein